MNAKGARLSMDERRTVHEKYAWIDIYLGVGGNTGHGAKGDDRLCPRL
jgi:hypothetical protein